MFLGVKELCQKRVVELRKKKKKSIFYLLSKTFNKTNNPIPFEKH